MHLFSLQLNYLCIWLTFSLLESQIFNENMPMEFQGSFLGSVVLLNIKNLLYISLLSHLGCRWAKNGCFVHLAPGTGAKRVSLSGLAPPLVLAQDSDFHPFPLPFLFSGTETYLLRVLLSRAREPHSPRKSWAMQLHKESFEVIQWRVSKPVACRPPAWFCTSCFLRMVSTVLNNWKRRVGVFGRVFQDTGNFGCP